MAILNDAMQTAPTSGQPPPTQSAQNGGEQATPDEQEAYERTVYAAQKALYDDATQGNIMQMLQAGAENPAQALAQATSTLIQQLDEQSGRQIPETVILPASEEILSLVAELAQESGSFEVNDQIMGQAGQQLLKQLADAYYPDGVGEDDIAELMQGMDDKQVQSLVAEQSQFAGG